MEQLNIRKSFFFLRVLLQGVYNKSHTDISFNVVPEITGT